MVCLGSALLTKEVLGAALSQDCALSATDPSQEAISEPFVRQVQVPIFAVNFWPFRIAVIRIEFVAIRIRDETFAE